MSVPRTVSPEKVNASEVGLKSQFVDRRLLLNLASFWTDIGNYQSAVTTTTNLGTSPQHLQNVGKVRSRGVEADATLALTRRISLNDGASYVGDANGGNGVLVTRSGGSAVGDRGAEGVPTFLYRAVDRDEALVRLAAPQPLLAVIIMSWSASLPMGPGIARGGRYVMQMDGKTGGELQVASTFMFTFTPENKELGHDSGTALTDDYAPPFAFDGTLRSVTIDLAPTQIAPVNTAGGGT